MAFDGVTFVTTDGTKWGAGKGAPLTANEADNDLWELLRRLNAIEVTPPTAVSISNILISGSQLSFQMSDGSSFGPFTLPIATFRLRGDYVPGTHYFELDLVSVPQQGLFLVRLEHNGANPFNPAATDGSGNALYLKVFGEDTYIYDVGFFYPGVPGVGIEGGGDMAAHMLSRRVASLAGLPGSIAKLRVAPTANLSFPIALNGDVIGWLDFALGATDGVFNVSADQSYAIGDIIAFQAPTALDVAARDLLVTFQLTRVI
jgi:hypothetical protein